jgi:hypothetical protein
MSKLVLVQNWSCFLQDTGQTAGLSVTLQKYTQRTHTKRHQEQQEQQQWLFVVVDIVITKTRNIEINT